MADKIKGWVDQFSVPPHQRERNENITVQDHKWLSGDLRCTLVIGDERVFTESEVRELLRSMMQLIDGDPEQVLAAIEAVNLKHGLGLSDPA